MKGIKEQLFLNDYLVLPNFGGFVLKSRPAHFSVSGAQLVPPSKTVSFNAQLKQNDGIMAIWLQQQLSCEASEALNHLTEFSAYCSSLLQAKRRLSIEGIGFFYLDFENNTCFEPQQDANFLTESFGLSPLSIIETEPVLVEMKREPVFVDRSAERHVEQAIPATRSRNYRRMVVPALFTILFVSLFLLFVSNQTIKGELQSALFTTNSRLNYSPINYPDLNLASETAANKVYVADANGIAGLNLDNDKTLAVRTEPKAFNSLNLNSSKTHAVPHAGNFEVVLGCFSIRENATKMISKLDAQNLDAIISGQNAKGMYIVANGNFETKDEAITRLQELKNKFPNAWIKQVN